MSLLVEELKEITEDTGCQTQSEYPSVIAGLVPLSNGKSPSLKKNSRNTKSSLTSVVDLTGNEKDFSPYWSKSVAELSSKLWLPTGTDFADLDSSLSNGFANKTLANSWFSTVTKKPPTESLSKTSQQLSQCSLAGCMVAANIVRTRKIRLQVSKEQRRLLLVWCGAARYFYNQAVEKNATSWRGEIDVTRSNTPDWAKLVPYQIKKIAVKDYIDAKRACFKKHLPFHLSFRSRKARKDSIFIPKQAIKSDGIYVESLQPIKFREKLGEIAYDCRLIHVNGKFYLSVPFDKPVSENQATGLIAVDPGVRNFLAYYTPDSSGKIAPQAINRIQRLCSYMDNLISRRKFKPARRIRESIQNLIGELHHKVARWLVNNFAVIILPKFNAQEMVIRNKRKISSKTARKMLTLAHGRFRQILLDKAEECGSLLIFTSEAYTSKTCSSCGKIHEIGGKKTMNCCGIMDRDINGARGIMLRALSDTTLRNHAQVTAGVAGLYT